MVSITNTTELKRAIATLELEQYIKSQELKKQFHITYESLKPLNLIENTIREIVSSPFIGKSILGTTLGLTLGFLTKKATVGKSHNVFRKLFGSFLQHGIINFVAQNPETLKKVGSYLFEKIRNKKESATVEMD